MAKITRNHAITLIESSMIILDNLRDYLIEEESGADSDDAYMQELLDSISHVAEQRADNPDKTPIIRIKLRQDDTIVTVLFDVQVELFKSE